MKSIYQLINESNDEYHNILRRHGIEYSHAYSTLRTTVYHRRPLAPDFTQVVIHHEESPNNGSEKTLRVHDSEDKYVGMAYVDSPTQLKAALKKFNIPKIR
jgi:hypothetical protein